MPKRTAPDVVNLTPDGMSRVIPAVSEPEAAQRIAEGLAPAVGYLRKSPARGDTEVSIERQQQFIPDCAASRGCFVKRWYVDEAVRGDDVIRPGFARMLQDAEAGDCDFEAIFVWDQRRFSRARSESAGEHFLKLMECGIRLESATEGTVLDPASDDPGKQIIRSVNQTLGNLYLADLAKNTASGKVRQALRGVRGGAIPPLGCRRRDDGRYEAGDPADVAVLLELASRVDRGDPLLAIARDFNRRCIPTPRKKYPAKKGRPVSGKWTHTLIRKILSNDIYIGGGAFAKHCYGLHAYCGSATKVETTPIRVRLKAERVAKTKARKRVWVRFRNPSGGIVPEQPQFVGDPLLPLDQWQRIQRVFAGARPKAKANSLPLCPILRCAICGRRFRTHNQKVGGEVRYSSYICTGNAAAVEYADESRAHAGYNLPARETWQAVTGAIFDQLLSDDQVDKRCGLIEAFLRRRAKTGAVEVEETRREIAKKEAQFDRLMEQAKRFSNPTICARLDAEADQLSAELDQLKRDLGASQQLAAASQKGIKQQVEQIRGWLLDQREKLMGEHAAGAIRRLFKSIVVDLDAPPQPKVPRRIVAVGLELNPESVVSIGSNKSILYQVMPAPEYTE